MELCQAVKTIKTTGDLIKYLYNYKSPVTADIIVSAIKFFMLECRTPDGKKDWKAIKERKRMGLNFQLTCEHELSHQICSALTRWMIAPGYGRDIGTGFTENLLSARMGEQNPRYRAFHIIYLLSLQSALKDPSIADPGIVNFFSWHFVYLSGVDPDVYQCARELLLMERGHLAEDPHLIKK